MQKIYSHLKLVVLLAASTVLFYVLIGKSFLWLLSESSSAWRVAIGGGSMGIAMLLASFVAHRLGMLDSARHVLQIPKPRALILCYLLGFALPVLALLICWPFGTYKFDYSGLNDRNLASVVRAFSGAMREEIFYRFWVFAALVYLFRSIPIAVALQALIFAATHRGATDFFGALYFMSGGIFLAAVLLQFRSLWAAVVVHAGVNSTIALLYGGRFQFGNSVLSVFGGMHDAILVGIFLCLSAGMFFRQRVPLFGGDFFGMPVARGHAIEVLNAAKRHPQP